MDVYDSGVWVWGLTEQAPAAVERIDRIMAGDRTVGMSAYIHGEVTEAFDRSVTAGAEDIRTAKERFNVIVAKRDNVVFRDHDAIAGMDIHAVRRQQSVRLLGRAWGIQPKDVPILMFAEELDGETTVHTTDAPLAEFDPGSVGIEDVSLEHVET